MSAALCLLVLSSILVAAGYDVSSSDCWSPRCVTGAGCRREMTCQKPWNFNDSLFSRWQSSLQSLRTPVEARPVGRLRIVSRAEWRACASWYHLPQRMPLTHVVVHHTAAPDSCDWRGCAQTVRAMQCYHMQTRRWSDIGYNFVIAPSGTVYEGRGWRMMGAHVAKKNWRKLGVALIGNFTRRGVYPTRHAIKSLKLLITSGLRRGFISADYKVMGHRHLASNTICPGNNLVYHIKRFRRFSRTE